MPDDPNEVVVIVPDAPTDGATGSGDGSSPSDEPVVVEVFDAVVDPSGSSDPTDSTGTATEEPEVIVVEEGAGPDGEAEVIVIDPAADGPGTDGGITSDPTSGADPTTGDPTGQTDPTTGDPTTDPSSDPTGSTDP